MSSGQNPGPAGRSRGRARPQPTPGQTPTTPTAPAQLPTPRLPSPQRTTIPAEPGRGRGLTTTEQIAQPTAASISPTGGSSEESPPQQHSPPQSGAATVSVGRAATRGTPHQPGATARHEIIGPLERLALQETGEVAAARPTRDRIEAVLHTKPASCAETRGTLGTPLKILCNYFTVLSQPDWVLYQYHVDFSPVIDSKRLRLQLMKPHEGLFPLNKAFDGSTLYSLTKLHDEVTELSSVRETDQQIILIKIKRIDEIGPTSPQFVHLFNVVFRKCLKVYGMREIDRNYFDMRNRIGIPEYGIELINGFSTSVSNYENKLLLCAELTHKLLHKTTVYDLMDRIYNNCRQNEFRERCLVEITSRVVMTVYNDKTYKVDEIDFDSTPNSVFQQANGTSISFVEYYRTHYQINIQHLEQPLLVILPSAKDKRRGADKPILLVPELCVLTGVDEKMRTDFRFKKAVEQYSKVGPVERCNRLSTFVKSFNSESKVQAELQKWKMNFSSQPCEIDARALPPESLMFGNNVVKQLTPKADWSNEMKAVPLLKTIPLNFWIVVFPAAKRQTAEAFVQLYGDVIRGMGISALEPGLISAPNDAAENMVNTIKSFMTSSKEKAQMVVAIVTSKRKDRYDAIKRLCCLDMPVPSQVVTSQIIEDPKKAKSVVTKVAIQMNCKLGGELWLTKIPMKSVMICGIDTYHDSAKKKGSVCAFIATANPEHTRFFSRASLQETHQELSSNLTLTVKSSCEHYLRANGHYPEKIIIYRDGVSDGQLALVINSEIPQIQKAFGMLDVNYKPLMAVVIVKKRGNARFFARFGNNLENPPCGTIIDSVVTRSEWFDFYLISQHVTQGTVNPTHYNVIYDTIALKPDHFQKLSYKLTHMYYNWPGTIRVPALCQYAHKLAFLVGQSLHREHSSSLCDKLFYL